MRARRVVLAGCFLFFTYVLLGMTLPFVTYQQVSEELKNRFTVEDFYGEGISADRAAIIEDNVSALDERIRLINMAQQRIILSTFDMREGESIQDLTAVLFEAADRGVNIRILVDGVSGLIRMERNSLFHAISSYPNIEVRVYNTPNLLKPWTLNGRMHDKYLIADDTCYLLGGRNTFDYFLGDYETDSRSYDREVLVYNTAHGTEQSEDSSLHQLEQYFEQIWASPYVDVFHKNPELQNKPDVIQIVSSLKERLQNIREQKPELFDAFYSYDLNTVPVKKATLIHNPIHITGKEPDVWYQLQKLMEQAKQRVVIHTPYVVMEDSMYQGMRAIGSKVPDFSMVVNSVDNGDNFVASSDYLIHKKDVVETGVQIYEFDGGESTHGKSILIDHDLSVIGSYNLDLRSTYVDTELMLVIDSPELNQILEKNMEVFQEDTRKVIDEDTYEPSELLPVQKAPLIKRILWRIAGPFLQLFRCLI